MKDNRFESRPDYLSLCARKCVAGKDKIFPVTIKQHSNDTKG